MKRNVILASLLLIIVSSVPYLFAQYSGNGSHVFSGFLVNPLDGNSYLAKMRQGFAGYWSFTLPYTPEPGSGTYINLLYILLGHLARITGSSLIFTYHFFRVCFIPLLVIAVWNFFHRIVQNNHAKRTAFWLALIGSGMGWIILPFLPAESITSDLWVTEAYPFLSLFSSPHFTLGMALQVWLLTPRDPKLLLRSDMVRFFLAGLLLAIVSPFFIPVVLVVLAGMILFRWIGREKTRADIMRLTLLGLGAGPVLLYDVLVVYNHPVLSGWTAQNVTPSPPLWDILFSLSPALIAAIFGLWVVARDRKSPEMELVIWLLSALIIMSVPFSLQRRFISGLYLPVAGLAAIGLWSIAANKERLRRLAVLLVFLLSLPSNIVIYATSAFAIQTLDSQIYLTLGEWEAFSWMRTNTTDGALFLAAPDTGLYIPAHTNSQVIYGHPFETVNADNNREDVTGFFSNWSEDVRRDYLSENGIDFLFIGPRERSLGKGDWGHFGNVIYEADGVAIYRIQASDGH